jgi:hypothetical protein
MSRVSLICLRVSVSYITVHVAKDSLLHNTYVSTMQLNEVFDIFSLRQLMFNVAWYSFSFLFS